MKIALVDDQKEEINRILPFIQNALPHAKIFTFPGGPEFLETWKEGEYDLILLDIFMEESLGINVAQEIRATDKDVRIVFCTTSNEFACESYEVGASYYLQKPVSETVFQKMLTMIRLADYEKKRFVRLPDGQRILLRNIIYSEYHNHLITIHMKHGDKIQTRITQTEWESILAEQTYLYSCSKGIVINFYEVSRQDAGLFVMSNGTQIPISRRKTKEALTCYASFCFEKMRKENF